jgi:septal ring factor EnvC (AmiA/AmiB activator)
MKRANVLAWLACLLVAAALPGCATEQRQGPGEAVSAARLAAADSAVDVELVLSYFRHVGMLSHDDLSQEFAEAKDAFSEDPSAANRFRLVVLLCVPNASFRDDALLLRLLHEYMTEPSRTDGALHNLAHFLYAVTEEHKGQAGRNRELDARLKDEQRRGSALQQQLKRQGEQLQKLEQKLKEEQKRSAVLAQQLEALKTIEKSLRRDKPQVQTK